MKFSYLLPLILSGISCNGQSIGDFFFPSNGNNVSMFQIIGEGEMKVYTSLTGKGDSAVITTLYFNSNTMTDWSQRVIKYDHSQINLSKELSKSNPDPVLLQKEIILLKMPSRKEKIEWLLSEQSGSIETRCTSEFCTIKIDGVKKQAIKVTTHQNKKRSGNVIMTTVDYYVYGVGHYKTTSDSGRPIITLKSQKYDPNQPVLR
jgi:hypothetical protein